MGLFRSVYGIMNIMIDASLISELLLYFVPFLIIVVLGGIVSAIMEGKKNKRKKEQEMLNASMVDSLMKDSANNGKINYRT